MRNYRSKAFYLKLVSFSILAIVFSIVIVKAMAQKTITTQPTVEELWRQEERRIGDLENQIRTIDLQIIIMELSNSAVLSAYISRQRGKIIDLYTQIIDNSPHKHEAGFSSYYIARGVTYSETGQWDKAIDDLNTVLAVAPNDLFALKDRAIINREAGNLAASLADFKAFLTNVEKLEIKDSWDADVVFATAQVENLKNLVN